MKEDCCQQFIEIQAATSCTAPSDSNGLHILCNHHDVALLGQNHMSQPHMNRFGSRELASNGLVQVRRLQFSHMDPNRKMTMSKYNTSIGQGIVLLRNRFT